MATVVNSFSIFGIDGYLVKIEINTIYGQPSVSIVGMGDTAIKEARESLEAAIIASTPKSCNDLWGLNNTRYKLRSLL